MVATVGNVFRPVKLTADVIGSSVAIIVFLAAVTAYRLSSHAETWDRLRNVVVAFGILAACLGAMNQVHGNALPLTFVALIILSERALREREVSGSAALPAYSTPLLAATLLVLLTVYKDVRTVETYISDQGEDRAIPFCDSSEVPACAISYAFFDPHALQTLAPFPNPELRSTPADDAALQRLTGQARSVSQHLASCNGARLCALWSVYSELYELLNLVLVADDRPYLLGFMNPIPFYYGVEPPKHVPAWIDMGRTLSAAAHPEAGILFSDVTLLVVPKTDLAQDYRTGLLPIYADDIKQRFEVIAETESWSIWRRKQTERK